MNFRVRFKELFNRRALVRREIVRDRLRTRCGGPPFYSISVDCHSPSRRGYRPSHRDIVVTGSLFKTQLPSCTTRYEIELVELGKMSCWVMI